MSIDNTDDMIDTRNVLERIEELADEVEGLTIEDDEILELANLAFLIERVEDVSRDSSKDGVGLIRDSYFQSYAQELAEDIGAIPKKQTWPGRCIDWEQAAHELRMDYSSVDFDGVEYWVRS
jgi:hypothetical protein